MHPNDKYLDPEDLLALIRYEGEGGCCYPDPADVEQKNAEPTPNPDEDDPTG